VTVRVDGITNKKCIFISRNEMARGSAENRCRKIAQNLLTIHHLDEHNQIMKILHSAQFDGDNYWIGLVSEMWWDRDQLLNRFKV